MAKLIAYRENGERVFMALINNGVILGSASAVIISAKNTDEEISNTLRELMNKTGMRAGEGAAALSDNSCIMKVIDVTGMSAANLAMNLPYDFGDYLSAGQEINFVFDYQMLPVEKQLKPAKKKGGAKLISGVKLGKTPGLPGMDREEKKPEHRALATAVSRSVIAREAEIAKDAGFTLSRLAPESIALGDLVETSPFRDSECCIITMGMDSAVIRIYHSYETIASHEINVGLRPVRELLADHNFSFFDGNPVQRSALFEQAESMEVIRSLVGQIAYALEYFQERGFYHEETEVFLAGEGALIPPLVKELSAGLSRECRNVSALMRGRIKDEDAAMLAPAIGAGIFR